MTTTRFSRGDDNAQLAGARILIVRAQTRAPTMEQHLERLGAHPIWLPTIKVVPPADPNRLHQAAREIGSNYDGLILTSVNAVHALHAALAVCERPLGLPATLKIWAVGPATAHALQALGYANVLVPEHHRSEGLLALLDEQSVRGKRFLLPCAERARPLLPETLRKKGAAVDVVVSYRTVVNRGSETALGIERLRSNQIDVLLCFSGACLEALCELLDSPAELRKLCENKLFCAIGPVTAKACYALGLMVDIVSKQATVPCLIAAVASYWQQRAQAG